MNNHQTLTAAPNCNSTGRAAAVRNKKRLEKLHNENLHNLHLWPNTAMVINVKRCKRFKGEEQWVSKRTCLQNSDTKWHITSDTGCEHTSHIRSRGGLLWWWWWTSGYSVSWFITHTHRLPYPAWRTYYWQWTTCHPAFPNKDVAPGPAPSCPQIRHVALGRHMAWGAVAAASEKLANISRRNSTSPICQMVAAYQAMQLPTTRS